MCQEYGARVPMAVLDGDDTTLRSLVSTVRASYLASGQEGNGGAGVPVAEVKGVTSAEVMTRETPSRFVSNWSAVDCCVCKCSNGVFSTKLMTSFPCFFIEKTFSYRGIRRDAGASG